MGQHTNPVASDGNACIRPGSITKTHLLASEFYVERPTFMKTIITVLFVLCLLGGSALGQQDGVPNFSAADVHEYDTINLYTLTPTINIPVINKRGAIPLSIALTAQQTCLGSSQSQDIQYACPSDFGIYLGDLEVVTTYQNAVKLQCPNTGFAYSFSGWDVYSSDGLDAHLLPYNDGLLINMPASGQIPQGNCTAVYSFTDIVTDDSGYSATISVPVGTLTANGFLSAAVRLTNKNGNISVFSTSANLWTDTDPFGNAVSITPGISTIRDSLGAHLTENIAPHGISNESVQYTDTNGNLQAVTLTRSATAQQVWIPGNPETCKIAGQSRSIYPVLSATFPDTTSMSFTYEQGSESGSITGRISSFTTREDGTISYVYPPPCSDNLETGNPTLTRTTSDGITTYTQTTTQNYRYTTILDPGMNKTIYYFAGGGFPFGLLSEKEVYQNAGTVSNPTYVLLSTDVYCYNGNQSQCQSAIANYPITQRDTYHTDGSMTVSSRISETFDSYGNRTYVARYGYGASGYTTATTVTYTGCGQASNVADLPCTVVTGDGTHTLSQTTFTYNSAGFMLTSSMWNGSKWIVESYLPNPNGTVATRTDPNGANTTYGYAATGSGGCKGLLPTSMSVTPLNGDTLTSSKTWNCDGAVVMGTTDPNGNNTSTTYDAMIRMWTFTDESGLTTTTSYTGKSVTSSYSFGGVSFSETTTTDGYGRPILSQATDGSKYDTTSTGYYMANPYALVMGSTPSLQSLGNGSPLNSYAYFDALLRSQSTINANGGQSVFTYTGGTNSAGAYAFDKQVTVGPPPTGAQVKVAQDEYDGLGRLISACGILTSGGTLCGQVDGGSGVLTSFAYSFGTGTSTVAATRGLQTHTTVSDALGRPILVTTPESGTVTNTYDSDSGDNCGSSARNVPTDLAKITRNDNSYVCFIYNDGLHGLTDVMNSIDNSANPCRRYRYDNSTGVLGVIPSGVSPGDPLGHLVEAETDTCASPITLSSMITDEWFGYDKNGRLTDVWEYTLTGKTYYHTSVSYYLNGVPNTLSGLPGYPSLTYGLDGEGRWYTAMLGSIAVVSGVAYDAAGQPLSVSIGSGSDEDEYSYDALEQMAQYQFVAGAQNNEGVLTWNQDGTLGSLAITDGVNSADSQTCKFGYDAVARLTNDICGSVWSQTYSYDQYDNLTKSGNASWIPGYNPTNNQYQNGATYDANGNLTFDGAENNYTWDQYGKMATANGVTVTYDAFGRPVTNGSVEILYTPLGKVGVLQYSTEFYSAYVPLPGGGAMSLGCCSSDNIWYLHRDWLGTSRVVSTVPTSGNGGAISDRSFSPYGDVYLNYGYNDPLFFADMNSDLFATSGIASGIYDTPNRELAMNASRWLSPDPAGASWNAYAYPTDPNRGTDPTGLFETGGGCEDGGLCGGEYLQDTQQGDSGISQINSPKPAASCGFFLLCWLKGQFGSGSGNSGSGSGPAPSTSPIGAGWDNTWSSFTAQAADARTGLNNTLQNAEKGVDWYNKWLGFAPTDCSNGGDCINALGMAGTSVYVGILSAGESEEANGAKAVKQLQEAPAVVNFLRNQLLAQTKDPELRGAVNELFRAAARVGDGSSMAMLREEIQTGAEKKHWEKLITRRTQLLRIYRSGRLGASDRAITRGLLISIQDALAARPPI